MPISLLMVVVVAMFCVSAVPELVVALAVMWTIATALYIREQIRVP